jgi:hypothetical protein
MIEGFLKILRDCAGKASVLLVASRVDVSFIAKPLPFFVQFETMEFPINLADT